MSGNMPYRRKSSLFLYVLLVLLSVCCFVLAQEAAGVAENSATHAEPQDLSLAGPADSPQTVPVAPRYSPKIAVYTTGGSLAWTLTIPICKALEKSGTYAAVKSLDEGIAADDNEISRAGAQVGVHYVCVVDISQAAVSPPKISVRILDTQSAAAIASVTIDGQIRSASDVGKESKKIIRAILVSGPQPDPELVAARAAARLAAFSVGGGAFFANDVNGISWATSNGQLTMPSLLGGVYIFFDATYAEMHVSYSAGGGWWESGNATVFGMPYMSYSHMHLGLLVKYPILRASEHLKLFPMAGGELEFAVSGKLTWEEDGIEYLFDGQNGRLDVSYLSSPLLLKIGAGADFDVGIGNLDTYIRTELLYCVRRARPIEGVNRNNGEIDPRGHGLTLRVGMGWRLGSIIQSLRR